MSTNIVVLPPRQLLTLIFWPEPPCALSATNPLTGVKEKVIASTDFQDKHDASHVLKPISTRGGRPVDRYEVLKHISNTLNFQKFEVWQKKS